MRVLRVYHSGRDPAHRARDRALVAAGVDVTLVVPASWPENGAQDELSTEPFPVVEAEVHRPGDVNRHRYRDPAVLSRIVDEHRPDLLDLHEEPVSLAARQWLRAATSLPVVMYTAQNLDKRYPVPYAQYELAAYRRVNGMYPCTRQAASVVRGKGFTGPIEVLPLGVDPLFSPGAQDLAEPEIRVGLVGRLVPEKGVLDAVRVVADLNAVRKTRLHVIGEGPERERARALADALGVGDRVEFLPWQPVGALAALYRQLHVVLVPSRATETWVEQFGRIIPEAQASGAVVAGYASGAITEVGAGTCVLAPEGAVDELTDSLRGLLASPGTYEELRERGIRRAAEASWASVAQRQAEFYARVVSSQVRRPRPARQGHRRRELAIQEFGHSAELVSGERRSFALPVLRKPTRFSRAAAGVIDASLRWVGR